MPSLAVALRRYDLRPGKPPERKLDASEGYEGGQGFGKVLEILCKTPVSSEPGEGTLDQPAARQDDETPHVGAPPDNPHAQQRYRCHQAREPAGARSGWILPGGTTRKRLSPIDALPLRAQFRAGRFIIAATSRLKKRSVPD